MAIKKGPKINRSKSRTASKNNKQRGFNILLHHNGLILFKIKANSFN